MNSTGISFALRDRLSAVLIFLACFVSFFLLMDLALNVYDEGLILTGAMRVAAGDIPHRDFYANYGPGSFYLLAWLFDLFGQSTAVERLLDLTIRAAIPATMYATLILYCRRTVALLLTGVAAIWLCFIGGYGYPLLPVLLLALIGSAVMVRVLAGDAPVRYAFFAGALSGSAALFRYEVGFLVFIAHLCATLVTARLANHDLQLWLRHAWPTAARYIAGAAIVVMPLLVWYGWTGALEGFIHDLVDYPVNYYPRNRNLPFPSIFGAREFLKNITIYLPIFIFLNAVFHLHLEKRRAAVCFHSNSPDAIAHRRDIAFVVVFGLLAAFCYTKGLVRIGILTLLLSIVPAFMMLAVLAGSRLARPRRVLVAAWILVVLSCATAFHQGWGQVHYLGRRQTTPYFNSTSSSVFAVPRLAIWWDRGAVISFIRENTKPGERIYVGLTRHDKILFNDNFIYFMTNRMPATHWHHFDPGLQTRADIQARMIEDLERWQPRYAVLESTWNDMNEPNGSAHSSGVTLLDDYLRAHYHTVAEAGALQIWKRKAHN
jgi:hypothetical protein